MRRLHAVSNHCTLTLQRVEEERSFEEVDDPFAGDVQMLRRVAIERRSTRTKRLQARVQLARRFRLVISGTVTRKRHVLFLQHFMRRLAIHPFLVVQIPAVETHHLLKDGAQGTTRPP